MSTLALVKYALALAGIALILFAERQGMRWLGYAGLVLVLVAFFLRFVRRSRGPGDAG